MRNLSSIFDPIAFESLALVSKRSNKLIWNLKEIYGASTIDIQYILPILDAVWSLQLAPVHLWETGSLKNGLEYLWEHLVTQPCICRFCCSLVGCNAKNRSSLYQCQFHCVSLSYIACQASYLICCMLLYCSELAIRRKHQYLLVYFFHIKLNYKFFYN